MSLTSKIKALLTYANGVTSKEDTTLGDAVKSLSDRGDDYLDCIKKILADTSIIVIPYGVTEIRKSAFASCESLTSITIPNSVKSIGAQAFASCESLTSITIPNSLTSIEENTFNSCKSLTSITIPNSVTSIGASAFYKCTGLTSLAIPNSVTSIGAKAFASCSGLTSVTIPNSVTSIGNDFVYGASNIISLIFEGATPPTWGDTNEGDDITPKCNIYVPSTAIDAYKTAYPKYASRIVAIEE